MAQRIGRMSPEEIDYLVTIRPDAFRLRGPRDPASLARLLDSAHSLGAYLVGMPLPFLQITEAAAALNADCTVARLTQLLNSGGRPASDHSRAVESLLDELQLAGAILVGEDSRLLCPGGLAVLFPSPLGLGRPLRPQVENTPANTLRRMLTNLGVTQRQGSRKKDLVESMLALLGDAQSVRDAVDSQPEHTRELLQRIATRGDDDAFDGLGYSFRGQFDKARYTADRAALSWAVDRGLMFGHFGGYNESMPCEIRIALRGPQFRLPFDPDPPVVLTRAIDQERCTSFAAAAATDFADHALAILDRVSRAPLTPLKSGGVGMRELGKLAKTTQSDPTTTRLVVELAGAAGLITPNAQGFGVAKAFAKWRASAPADRLVALLRAWWDFVGHPSTSHDGGAALPALSGAAACGQCTSARHAALAVLAEADGAVPVRQVVAKAHWAAPFAHLGVGSGETGSWGPEGAGWTSGWGADADGIDDEFAEDLAAEANALNTLLWHEFRLLGVVADDAITSLGRAMVADDWQQVGRVLGAALPPAADQALFGADLTAYVTGAPTTLVSTLLDSAAEREGRGGAVGWRFSPASVRRAMDAGATAESLLSGLAGISTTGQVPQPLRYLIGDVGSRHGSLRVGPALSVIRSDDESLMAQVAADRKLARLGLRAVAPTVAVGQVPQDELLSALRDAGYLPMPEEGVAVLAAKSQGTAGRQSTGQPRRGRSRSRR